jgi:ssDNA-binding Zn-finger/Zn-ribbon topoisomerase 1
MADGSGVFVRFGKIFVIVALITTTGAHWAALQSVAWTTMLADNLRTHSLSESVSRTFDGNYPCPICRAIAAAKQSEKKSEFTAQMQKLEFTTAQENFAPIAPSHFQLLPVANAFAESLSQPPLTPPPRSFFV